MNRRQFNGLLAAAAFTRHTNYPWKLGVITDQVDLRLSRTLRDFFPRYNLRWAEIRYLTLNGKKSYVYADATQSQLKEIKQHLDGAGVKLSVLDTAVYKITLPGTTPISDSPAYVDGAKATFDRQLDDLKRATDAAHSLGTDRIRIFTFRRVADPAAVFSRIVEELSKALAVAQQQDVTLLVENEYDCNTGTGQEIAQLFAAIPDKRLMHNWDPCNAYEMGEQPFPATWNQLDHSRISHIHLKDAAGKEWKPMGAGKINFTGQFRALKDIRYAGTLSLETRYRDTSKGQYNSSVESMNGLMDVLRKV